MASFLPYPYLRVPHSDNFILQTVPTMSHSYRRFAQWIPWGHGLPFQLNRHATVQFVQRQLFWVCPSRHDSSCSSNYGLHWSKGMGSRWLPSTRVCADGEPKVWHPRYPMPGCGEAKSQSLGEKLWLWCQRWALPRKSFGGSLTCVVSPAGAVHFKECMVSELWASGQDAHVDHVNLDDVANSNQLSFLDLSRQSCSESNPRRVVPTISIIIYFNAVGGLCFPKSDMGSIAAKPGRMVLFHNYEDELRPCHKPSAAHCGIYFEKLPKRVLVMGVLANETPQFQGTPPPSAEALIYCAGTQRDPLFHDHPSYDCYKRAPDDGKPKPELVLTLELICSEDNMLVNCRNTAGESLCNLVLAPTQTLEIARCHIQYWADRYSSYNIILALPGGQLLSKEHDSLTLSNLSELEGAASSSDQPQPAEPSPPDQEPARHTGSGSCCSQT